MKIVSFTIPGEPKGKGRHRTTHTQGGKAIQYTPKGTRLYEETVANEYLRQCGNVRVGDNEYVDIKILAYFKIPKSANKEDAERMRKNIIRPAKKPDVDNIIKIVADALNGIAYKDDKQIVDSVARKFYSDTPCVKVKITSIDQEEF